MSRGLSPHADWSIVVFTAADEPALAELAYQVRAEVFVGEQGVPLDLERDARDDDADHALAQRAGRPIGAARLVVENPGFAGLDEAWGPIGHLGRLAVRAGGRRQGLGAALVTAVEQRAVRLGLTWVYLGAQTQAVPFYERLGYAPFGEEFDDAGLPHRHMARRVAGTAETGEWLEAPEPC
jgi:predicted GNAT family N-acyltransferase